MAFKPLRRGTAADMSWPTLLNRHPAPAAAFAAALVCAALLAAAALTGAMRQPWMGVTLAPAPDGGVLIAAARDGGAMNVAPGTALKALGSASGKISVEAADLTPEPDALPDYAAFERFLQRQDGLNAILRAGPVTLETGAGEVRVAPAGGRPAGSLPVEFWVQLIVGVGCFGLGAWVWSLRRGDRAAQFFATGGLGVLVFALSAAVYSTRELALDGALFRTLSALNHFGAGAFGVSTIALFLTYPRRVAGMRVILPVFLIAFAWWVGDTLWLFPGPPAGQHLPTALEMAGILLCIGIQAWATRGRPAERAALRWLGLSVAIGAGSFILIIVLPNLFGLGTAISQGYAFLGFLLIYVGLALGIARYRLFELEEWAFKILFYMAGAAILLMLDALLVYAVSLDRAPAFGVSLLIVAFLYLPLRSVLASRLSGAGATDRESLFRRVLDVALAHEPAGQAARWEALLRGVFSPLGVEAAESGSGNARIEQDGAFLVVPGADAAPTLRLRHARNGRRLFSPRDRLLADEIGDMLRHAAASRRAYEDGVSQERQRIARDMHDNIGAQLLSALHSAEPVRKDRLIRETLTDVRDILNNAHSPGLSFEEALAGLRAETAERLEAAGVALDWRAEAATAADLSPRVVHAVRSIVREAASNTIKHAGAARLTVAIALRAEALELAISDDGMGYEPGKAAPGAGLGNMRQRAEALGGKLEMDTGAQGTHIRARIPLETAHAPA